MIDPTELVVGILSDALTVPVTTEIPQERPQRLVHVHHDSDRSTEYLLMPRYNLTCWGTSEAEAKGICLSCVEALRLASEDHPYLSSCDLETMARDDWTRDGQSRYMAEIELVINVDDD